MGQIFTLSKLGNFETQIQVSHEQTFIVRLRKGIGSIWHDHRLRYLTVTPIVVKVFILGALPFVAFRLTKLEMPIALIGLLLTAFASGNAIGALSFRPTSKEALIGAYRLDSTILVLSGGILNILLFYWPNGFALGLCSVISGIFIARYSIELRALRQMIVSPTNMATVISSQAFLARIATPLAGIIYGFLLSKSNGLFQACIVVIFFSIGAFGIKKTFIAFSNPTPSNV